MIERLRALVAEDFDKVNNLIIDKIQSQVGLIDSLSHHIIESGGKRLRPLLVLLVSHACGYQGEHHIRLAAMIEFFHTATLLHDDVVDESTLRRGRETANEIWGSKASILVGDYLFTQSVQLMVDVDHREILRLFADVAHQISCGEVKQLANRFNLELTTEDYLDIIRSKTALLFAVSSAMGPLLAQSAKQTSEDLYRYGLHLGNAFQLIDDALDYCADTSVIGKNIGDDLADGKVTMPLLFALQNGNDAQRNIIQLSLKAGTLEHMPEILEAIKSTKAIEYTHQCAEREIAKAIACLSTLPQSIFKIALKELAEFALKRTH